MAPCAFSHRETVQQDVCITVGQERNFCRALIDADSWTEDGVPTDIAGCLDMPKPQWQALAKAERLVLTMRKTGEIYRMILDGITGRFLARRL
jgi:hypothetical protein